MNGPFIDLLMRAGRGSETVMRVQNHTRGSRALGRALLQRPGVGPARFIAQNWRRSHSKPLAKRAVPVTHHQRPPSCIAFLYNLSLSRTLSLSIYHCLPTSARGPLHALKIIHSDTLTPQRPPSHLAPCPYLSPSLPRASRLQALKISLANGSTICALLYRLDAEEDE